MLVGGSRASDEILIQAVQPRSPEPLNIDNIEGSVIRYHHIIYHMRIRRRSRRMVFFSQVFGKKNACRSNRRLSLAGDSLNMIVHSKHGMAGKKSPGLWYGMVRFHNEFFGSCTFCLFLILLHNHGCNFQACPHNQF